MSITDQTAGAPGEGAAESAPHPGGVRSPLLDVAGAVEAEGPDAGVAWHYGDPVHEQRRLEAGEAAVDLSNRGVLTVTGPDRLSWLNSLTSQSLLGAAPGEARETLVLSPHGHVEHDLHLVDDGSTVWITVEPGTATALHDWLDRMRFMLRVEVADVTARYAVVGAAPDLADRLRAQLVEGEHSGAGAGPVWVDPWPALGPVTASYAAVDEGAHPGRDRAFAEVPLPREALPALAASVPLAGTWAAEASRVAAWRPRLGFESDHRTIPHEVDWLRTAVHLQKGCYRGQETIARVHNLGRPPRRLVFLHLDGSEHVLPGHGDPVHSGDRQVGFVTTAARHHELGPIALALVKRSTPVDATLIAGGVAASQEVVVAP
jgi:tRNA-modifying protein YgfZ